MDFSQEMTEEILKIFQVESEEIISKLNNSLLDLEKKPTDKDAILGLFRDAHSLKGASRMVGFNNVQTIAHKMEDILGLAKEDKILLNSTVVNTLYKTVDFLSEIIQKSIAKGQEVYTEDMSKHISLLENLKEQVENLGPIKEQKDFDLEVLTQNFDRTNSLISETLFVLMKMEISKDENLIDTLLELITELYDIFKKVGHFNIKQKFEDIKVKLEFICKASHSITDSEIEDILKGIDTIITTLISICELYNLKILDYYSIAFEKLSETPQSQVPAKEKTPQELKEELIETIEPTYTQELTTKVESGEETDFNELKKIQDIVQNSYKNNTPLSEIKELMTDYQEKSSDKEVKNIFDQIIKILDFEIKNELNPDEETINVIIQSIEHCNNVINNRSEDSDKELVSQRLSIIQQILEINQIKDEESSLVPKSSFKIKNKITDFSKIFNSGEIKTLRVDSSKLDSLINQVNELTITKIKTKKHLWELDLINRNLEDWQRNSTKTMNYLKYYEKKYFQMSDSDNPLSFVIKQVLTLFTDNNKRVQEAVSNITNLQRIIQEDDMKMSLIVDNLESMVKEVRVLPLATVFHLFGRMVRDIAQEKNKEIELEIRGSETSTDKKIIEEIKTPLIHIIRNAIDHGIETPEERIQAGKNPKGKIILSAKQIGGKVIIEIIDDGRGINLEKIKEKALQKGYLKQEEINSMTDEQLTNLIFAPGFSTGDEITNISGRGIGLDVVQTKISQLNGKVKIISELNKRCCVHIELPSAMSTIKAFLVNSSNQTFAIPIESINTIFRKEASEIILNQGKKSIIFNGKSIPLYDLSEILNLEKVETTKSKKTILIIENDDKIMALCVDQLIGDQEILHKKLSAPLYKLKNISGITTLISGEVCLILNIADIINSASTISTPCLSANKTKKANYKILLVDDSITTRTMEKNILIQCGYQVETTQDPIEAFEKLKTERFDLIISDIEMPEMDGFEFLEKLKTDEMFADIPVVMVSSIMTEENQKRAVALGAKDYILKSKFDQKEFQEIIEKILEKGD